MGNIKLHNMESAITNKLSFKNGTVKRNLYHEKVSELICVVCKTSRDWYSHMDQPSNPTTVKLRQDGRNTHSSMYLMPVPTYACIQFGNNLLFDRKKLGNLLWCMLHTITQSHPIPSHNMIPTYEQ